MNRSKLRGDDPSREGPKRRAAVSTDGNRPSQAAQTGSLSDTRRLEDIFGSRRRVVEGKEIEAEHHVKSRDIRGGTVVPCVWETSDILAYVKQGGQYLDARRFGALPRHRRAVKIVCAGKFRATLYGAWQLRHIEFKAVHEHGKEGMAMLVLRDDCEAAYVTKFAKFAWDVREGWRRNNCFVYCTLPRPHHTLLFWYGCNVWGNTTIFEHRHRTESESSIL